MAISPLNMKQRLLGLIEDEIGHAKAGRPAMIWAKLNALVDEAVIDGLYRASQAGVSIQLIVRGICCLRPGVPGLSENIRVRSIVGRYLEHSRIYHFAHGGPGGEPIYYIGSADLMPRNLDRRVEALVQITAPALQVRLREILDVNLSDTKLAWTLDAEGNWHKVMPVPDDGVETHVRLQELAMARRGGS
jgi:polyphosphate kinase